MLNYTDMTQNTYIRSLTISEIIARENCGYHVSLRTVCSQLTWSADVPYRWACMLQLDAVTSQR
jgi:hypothetical protein